MLTLYFSTLKNQFISSAYDWRNVKSHIAFSYLLCCSIYILVVMAFPDLSERVLSSKFKGEKVVRDLTWYIYIYHSRACYSVAVLSQITVKKKEKNMGTFFYLVYIGAKYRTAFRYKRIKHVIVFFIFFHIKARIESIRTWMRVISFWVPQ